MSSAIPKLDEDVTVAKQLLASIDAILFDCDGVLWTDAGVIEGAIEVVNKLKELGKKVILVTNNSRRTSQQYHEKVVKFGFKVDEDSVYCTSTVTALYLKNNMKFTKKAYVIGEASIGDELTRMGIPNIGVGFVEPPPADTVRMADELDFHTDPEVGVVIVGYDRYFSMKKCNTALQYLQDPNVHFVATNLDPFFPISSNKIAPGTGTLVTAVKTCCRRDPLVMGKPERPMFDAIQLIHNLNPERTMMVGDRLDTDILFGKNNGMKTVAVLTGVTSKSMLDSLVKENNNSLIPDFCMEGIGGFLNLL